MHRRGPRGHRQWCVSRLERKLRAPAAGRDPCTGRSQDSYQARSSSPTAAAGALSPCTQAPRRPPDLRTRAGVAGLQARRNPDPKRSSVLTGRYARPPSAVRTAWFRLSALASACFSSVERSRRGDGVARTTNRPVVALLVVRLVLILLPSGCSQGRTALRQVRGGALA